MKNNRKKAIIAAIILAAAVLLFPIRMNLKDGGSVAYKSLIYEIIKIHRLSPNDDGANPYIDGIEIKLFDITVYKATDE